MPNSTRSRLSATLWTMRATMTASWEQCERGVPQRLAGNQLLAIDRQEPRTRECRDHERGEDDDSHHPELKPDIEPASWA